MSLIKDKIVRDDLRDMALMESRTYTFRDAAACNSAKSTAYQLQPLTGWKFSVATDYANCTVTITRTE